MKKLSLICLVCTAMAVVLAGFAGTAKADVMTAGLTFSEETGAFTLDGASGAGTSGDPILLEETVTGLDVTMTITGLPDYNIDQIGAFDTSFFITKEVTNDTGVSWTSFDLEVQEILGTPSQDGDGLSFGQDVASIRPYTSSHFADVDEITDVRDFINFSNGTVLDGETVTFSFAISDNTPIDSFYLRQRPNFRPGKVVPEPTTLTLWSLGALTLVGFGWRRRKQTA